ncbi:MAG TPA: CbtB-domain containing protein [Actinomycetes bacterium]|nr:CbtB-domain containing protein [Actinomycetes bacterium]
MAHITTSPSSSRAAARVPLWGWAAVVALLAVVYAVGYDQGMLLEPLLGKLSTVNNYLHEFFHDGRHLLGFPCH